MFEETCQARDQPGDLDEACPAADMVAIPVGGQMAMLDAFPGCCRPNGMCGVVVNDVSLGGGIIPVGSLGLGCVDAAPFFPDEDPVTCGAGGGGNAGGSGNAGGEPAVVGGDGAGGASGGAGG
jgi:hypothetical protein